MFSYVLYYNIENSGINAVSASLFMKGIIMQIVWKKENKAGLSSSVIPMRPIRTVSNCYKQQTFYYRHDKQI